VALPGIAPAKAARLFIVSLHLWPNPLGSLFCSAAGAVMQRAGGGCGRQYCGVAAAVLALPGRGVIGRRAPAIGGALCLYPFVFTFCR